jgi:precorrin-8X/cobalt-precorrin-8 methylmutase
VTRPLFDSYLIVDWSSAGVPKTGKDSIWIAHAVRGSSGTHLENPPTRISAMKRISAILEGELAARRRVLAGFDFPFGYPEGTAARLAGRPGWEAIWDKLADLLVEHPKNANNRFDVAGELNGCITEGPGPFWANGLKRDILDLPRKCPAGYGESLPARKRAAERYVRSAQEVWKLSGAGSVGGQALTGIAALERLRRMPSLSGKVSVWPFDTKLTAPEAPIVIAEIYPSLIPPHPDEPVKDAGQVRALAECYSALDSEGKLAPLFTGPDTLNAKERLAIETEEAWILGVGFEDQMTAFAPARTKRYSISPGPSPQRGEGRSGREDSPQPLRYERDPHEIYRQSFATVRAEARIDHLPADLHEVAIRLVHSCGMTDVPNRLAWSDDVVAAACAALAAGAPILCDCEMVASGIARTRLPADNPVICTLNDPATPDRAAAIGNTRSAAAVELWRGRVEGSIAVIGNAPTALFHLLELLDTGWPKPAAIIAMPVGFVGAAESKAELAANPRSVPFLTLRGRRGGSAMASAVVNALAAGLEAPR